MNIDHYHTNTSSQETIDQNFLETSAVECPDKLEELLWGTTCEVMFVVESFNTQSIIELSIKNELYQSSSM